MNEVKIIRVIASALMLLTINANAQDFYGVATYQSKQKLGIEIDSTEFMSGIKEQVGSELQDQLGSGLFKQVMEGLNKATEKVYELSFNKEVSLYQEAEVIDSPDTKSGNVMVSFVGNVGGAEGKLYKNLKENRFVDQKESYGKMFLIKDEMRKLDWKLGTETKKIGDYLCYKATAVIESKINKEELEKQLEDIGGKNSENGRKSIHFISSNDVDAFGKKTITAWYTPQIPVSNGPENYHGLPGLILQVSDGRETLVCSKIVLNPKKKVRINEPKKGKSVSQKEFSKIVNKKSKEMLKNLPSGSEDNGGTMIFRSSTIIGN